MTLAMIDNFQKQVPFTKLHLNEITNEKMINDVLIKLK